MNIQIFGKSKCFDSKKALRFFKERGIPVHYVDLAQRPMSKGELTKVIAALGGGVDSVIDAGGKNYAMIRYYTEQGKLEKLLDDPSYLKTPIVRCGPRATVGPAEAEWKRWIAAEKAGQ